MKLNITMITNEFINMDILNLLARPWYFCVAVKKELEEEMQIMRIHQLLQGTLTKMHPLLVWCLRRS